MSPLAVLLIIIDACCNIFSDLFWSQGRLLASLYVYLGHDTTLLLSLLYTLLQLISDEVLRRRMLTPVLVRYWTRPARTFVYLMLTISWQVASAAGAYPRLACVGGDQQLQSSPVSTALMMFHYCAHRLMSLVYYHALSRPLSIKQYLVENMETQNNHKI